MFKKERSQLQNFDEAARHEWIETNGLGGWASSSIIGAHTRRYHGLMVAAVPPPADRFVMLSKMDETIIEGDQAFELSCNNYGTVIHPKGNSYQESFSMDLFPEFVYEAGSVRLSKTIAMVHGENTTLVLYNVLQAASEFSLELRPFIAVRDYHHLCRANNEVTADCIYYNDVFSAIPYKCYPHLYIRTPQASFENKPDWYYHFEYLQEKDRGFDYIEDLFTYGKFIKILKPGERWGVVISTENPERRDAFELFEREKKRREKLLDAGRKDDLVKALTLAADQFIVKRGDLKTVIAGYHWFADWGRDTMIALPGLCLATGRFDDAKKIIRAFAQSVNEGMLPNRFSDNDTSPEYNHVDGTLWYFIAIHKYIQATNDLEFILAEILPVLKEIINCHYKGTRFHIHVDSDGLLYSGEDGVQLTWMDAKIGDWVITPRTGKAVEINALWYNALRIFSELLTRHGETGLATDYNDRADVIKQQFNECFWNEAGGFLYDVINGAEKDASIRPNQLFAISLPYALLNDEQSKSVLKVVEEKLYTPVGLRSLATGDPAYRGIYAGDRVSRDGAYHQGTAWSWLLGPFIDALIKMEGNAGKVKTVIENFKYHLSEAGIGTISEIFDGDAPHAPQGCIAQAWSVGELLRVIKEYRLDHTDVVKTKANL